MIRKKEGDNVGSSGTRGNKSVQGAAFIVERTLRSCPWHVIGNFKFSTPEETGTKRQLLRSLLFLASSLAEVPGFLSSTLFRTLLV